MKIFLTAITVALLWLVTIPATTQAQTNILGSVMADTNGIIQRPRSFWDTVAARDASFSNAVNTVAIGSVGSWAGYQGTAFFPVLVVQPNASESLAVGTGINLLLDDGNVAVGINVLGANSSGQNNTAVGVTTLNNNIGSGNSSFGFASLDANGGFSTNSLNSAFGGFALEQLIQGSGNIALGYLAGNNLFYGSTNIYIGNAGGSNVENGQIYIGTAGVHTNTFIAGVIHGNGGGLTGMDSNNITGKINQGQIEPPISGTVDYTKVPTNGGTAFGLTVLGGIFNGDGNSITDLVTVPSVGHSNVVVEIGGGILTPVDITAFGGGVGGGGNASTNVTQNWTAAQQLTNTGNTLAGDGSGLTKIAASANGLVTNTAAGIAAAGGVTNPPSGTAGQILTAINSTTYAWSNAPSGGGGGNASTNNANTQYWTGAQSLTNTGNTLAGNGAGLTGVPYATNSGYSAFAGTANNLRAPNATVYCDLSGSDTNNGLSLAAPVQTITNAQRIAQGLIAIMAYPVIQLGWGEFRVTNSMIDPWNYVLRGRSAGAFMTNWTAAPPAALLPNENAMTCIAIDGESSINLGDNGGVENLTVLQKVSGHHPISTIGGYGSFDGDNNIVGYQTLTTTNAYLKNVNVYGYLIHALDFASTNLQIMTCENVNVATAETAEDIGLNNYGGPGCNFNDVFKFVDCRLSNGTKGSVDSPVGLLAIYNPCSVSFIGGSIVRSGGSGTIGNNNCISISGTNVTLAIGPTKLGGDIPHGDIYVAAGCSNSTVTIYGLSANPTNVINLSPTVPVSWNGYDQLIPLASGNGAGLTNLDGSNPNLFNGGNLSLPGTLTGAVMNVGTAYFPNLATNQIVITGPSSNLTTTATIPLVWNNTNGMGGSAPGNFVAIKDDGTFWGTNPPTGGTVRYIAILGTNILSTTNGAGLTAHPTLAVTIPSGGPWKLTGKLMVNGVGGAVGQVRFSPAVTNLFGDIWDVQGSGTTAGFVFDSVTIGGLIYSDGSIPVGSLTNTSPTGIASGNPVMIQWDYTIWTTNSTTCTVWWAQKNGSVAVYTTNFAGSYIEVTP